MLCAIFVLLEKKKIPLFNNLHFTGFHGTTVILLTLNVWFVSAVITSEAFILFLCRGIFYISTESLASQDISKKSYTYEESSQNSSIYRALQKFPSGMPKYPHSINLHMLWQLPSSNWCCVVCENILCTTDSSNNSGPIISWFEICILITSLLHTNWADSLQANLVQSWPSSFE